MIPKYILMLIVCIGSVILIQSLMPKTMAMKSTRNIDEFLIEDERTQKHNYMVQSDGNNNILRFKNKNDMIYDIESFELDTNPEEFSNLIIDYTDLKKNDVILLDNSIKTRTRKRSNIKRQKHNQEIQDTPCTCGYTRGEIYFGDDAFPRFVETRNCTDVQQQSCLFPYVCKEMLYNVKVLKRRETTKQRSEEVPIELKYRWISERWQVSVGCICTRDYRNTTLDYRPRL